MRKLSKKKPPRPPTPPPPPPPPPPLPPPLPPNPPPPSSTSVPINPGDNWQAIVNANQVGAVFSVKAGIHRFATVAPKNNQQFVGETGAMLTGARVLVGFIVSGSIWYAAGQTQAGQVHGECELSSPRCMYPEDLFIDDLPMKHVATLGQVTTGTWFFDYAADRIYIGDNPSGHTVETSVTRSAFYGPASGVVIRNLIIEKYASPAQMGAIGDQYPGAGWVVDSCDIRWNHGTGISVGPGGQVLRNYVHHNGQKGVGGSGDDILIEGNEIAYNNYAGFAGFNMEWEAGGTKFTSTNRLVVRDNYVHHNGGSGLWTDIDNINTLYEGNTSTDNEGSGIQHEISYAATIRNNTVSRNGAHQSVWLWGAQILVQNSQGVEVYGNRIVVGPTYGNGIAVVQQNRGNGRYGPYYAMNNYVHHNSVTHLGAQGASGVVADYLIYDVFSGTNRFDYNTYSVPVVSGPRWAWQGYQSWSGFRVKGQEVNGTATTS